MSVALGLREKKATITDYCYGNHAYPPEDPIAKQLRFGIDREVSNLGLET